MEDNLNTHEKEKKEKENVESLKTLRKTYKINLHEDLLIEKTNALLVNSNFTKL